MSPIVLNSILILVPALSVTASVVLLARARKRGGSMLVALLPIVVCVGLAFVLGHSVGGLLNRVAESAPIEVSRDAMALHHRFGVVDLHADPLLFGRDLLERSSVGHVDVPRLQEGGVALQVFSLVSKIPLGYNEEATDPDQLDIITLLGMTHLWPPQTWFSLHERALYHARRLAEMAERSKGQLRLIRSREDLDRLLAERANGKRVVGGIFAIEGAQVLGDDVEAELDALYNEGLRMASLTHFFDTEFAGSVQGLVKGGLTDKGRKLVAEFERRGVVIDLAHASHATIDDVLAIATRPLVFSHTGVAGTCDQFHNLTDKHIDAIAERGGVIGIGLWDTAVCGTKAEDTIRAMDYMIKRVGDEHVSIGSDFDGYVLTHFDATGLPALTQAMIDAGWSEETIRRVLGGNAIRVLRASLP